MALLDMTTPRAKLEFIRTLPVSSRRAAWRAANPPLAAEVDLWHNDVRRTAKFTADTVEEAIGFIEDQALLTSIEGSERRNGLRSSASSRDWQLRRDATIQAPEIAEDQRLTFTLSQLAGTVSEVIQNITQISAYRLDQSVVSEWFAARTDSEIAEMWELAKPHQSLIAEMLRRRMLAPLVTAFKGSSNLMPVTGVFNSIENAGSDMARFAVEIGLNGMLLAQSRWTAEGVDTLIELRQFVPVMQMRRLSLDETLKLAGRLSVEELAAIAGMDLTPYETMMLHDEILRIEAEFQTIPQSVISRLERTNVMTKELRGVYVKYCDPMRIHAMLLDVEEEERERLIPIIKTHRPDVFEKVFAWLNNQDESRSGVELFERLLPDTGSNVLLSLRGGKGWVARRIAALLAEELSDEHWKMFFAVVDGFPGTVADLVNTVKSLHDAN